MHTKRKKTTKACASFFTTSSHAVDNHQKLPYTFFANHGGKMSTEQQESCVKIKPMNLEEDDKAGLEQGYLHGECIRFALGMQKVTGWDMVGFEDFCHVGVQDPEGNLWDVRGQVTKHRFGAPFRRSETEPLVPISLKQVHEKMPTIDPYSAIAQRTIAELFPNLPHLPTSNRNKNLEFMQKVHTCSVKHNVWIAPLFSGPVFYPAIGEAIDDSDTTLYHLVGTNPYRFDRMLPRNVKSIGGRIPSAIDRFLMELTALSKFHDLWIRAPVPTAAPILSLFQYPMEKLPPYILQQSINFGGYLIAFP